MPPPNNKKKKLTLLSRLRTAVQRVRLLLSSTVLSRSWRIASVIRRASLPKRRFSFNDDRTAGLMLCSDETGSDGSGSGSFRGLQRTMSFPNSDDDDIDKRAERFIANFRRQLQMERQISLQLRYYRRGNSFQSPSP
ncbi:cotton fiber protein [Senna tora]|uniref:Cotton fiber protein n=1 Tax=Senna tora TaxID=362788 RepID=A0A834SLE5_9FABA|nr:cotton fiber protein [Senna tora]